MFPEQQHSLSLSIRPYPSSAEKIYSPTGPWNEQPVIKRFNSPEACAKEEFSFFFSQWLDSRFLGFDFYTYVLIVRYLRKQIYY